MSHILLTLHGLKCASIEYGLVGQGHSGGASFATWKQQHEHAGQACATQHTGECDLGSVAMRNVRPESGLEHLPNSQR
jgi:hypothetical protein